MDPDPTINPDFAGWNHVILWYCDGGSYSGARSTPLPANGTELWFQGLFILNDQLAALRTELGLSTATSVLLTGDSAGGLAAFLHADRVRSMLPASAVYGVVPSSGFFLDHLNATQHAVFQSHMRRMVQLMNVSDALNPSCTAAQAAGSEWRCVFANETLQHTKSDVFVLNSVLERCKQLSAVFDAPPHA